MAQRKPVVWIGGRRRQLPAGDTLAGAEPPVASGDTQQYYRGDKTWASLASAVRSVVLTGLSTATNAAITATDTILQALGKIQAQLDNRQPLDATLTALAALNSSANQTIYSTGSDAYALTSLTVYGRQLIGTADAPEARAALGLATSVTRDATTSATDTTSERLWRTNDLVKQTGPMDETVGSVLLRGAFGCGARIPTTYNSSNPLYITDFAAYRPTGVYLATGDGVSPASANAPPGSGNNQLLVSAWSSVSATQYFVIANSASAANKRAWIGNYYGTGNYAWAELWHNGNLVVGTSGNAVGKLNTANTWSAAQTFTTITASAGSVIGNNQIGANALELGINASGDRASFVDLHADDTNTDYSGRLLRNAGVNGTLDLLNVGTGATRLNSAGGPVQLLHQGNTRLATTAAGVDITGIVNSYGLSPLVTVSATSKTFALADAGTYQRFTAGSNATCTVPTNASVAYPIGSEIHIRRAANANLTIVAASGVTINAPSGGTLVLTNNMTCTLKKIGTDTWDLIGQTVPA